MLKSSTAPFKPSDKLSETQLAALGIIAELGKVIQIIDNVGDELDLDSVSSVTIGIFHTCKQFLEKAFALVHPFDSSAGVNDDVLFAAFSILTEGPDEIKRLRDSRIFAYEQLARNECDYADSVICNAMPVERRRFVQSKRVNLFKQMCEDAEYNDPLLAHLLVVGVDLVGNAGDCAKFPSRPTVATVTIEQLMKSSRWSRQVVMARSGKSDDDDIDKAVWEATAEELRKGWLAGPFDVESLRKLLGPLFVISRRFGVRQGDNVRPIDDFSASFVNSAFQVGFKVDLGGVDEIASTAKAFLACIKDDGMVVLDLSSGKQLKGRLHHSLSLSDARDIVGRTLDLESAYKQIPLAESSKWTAVLKIFNVDISADQLFVCEVLPFGASASVYAFNRFARALRTIGSRLFLLMWSNYFDDFPQLDIQVTQDHSQKTAEMFLQMLGWRVSMKDTKRKPFAKKYEALGVMFDFTESAAGCIHVANKPSRVATIEKTVKDILESGRCDQHVASSLRGVLQFSEGQLFGRAGALMMPVFKSRSLGLLQGSWIPPEMRSELEFIVQFIKTAIPRTLLAKDERLPLLIFTDAALEDNDSRAAVGAVMYDRSVKADVSCEFFGEVVPMPLLRSLQVDNVHVIACLEVLPVLLSLRLWRDHVAHRRIFLFIDNDAARFSLINSSSSAASIRLILQKIVMMLAEVPMFLWYTRVPSSSNIADAPSRGDFNELYRNGCNRKRPPMEV